MDHPCAEHDVAISTAATSIPLEHAEMFLLKIIKVLLKVHFDLLDTVYNTFSRSVSPIAVQLIKNVREKL